MRNDIIRLHEVAQAADRIHSVDQLTAEVAQAAAAFGRFTYRSAVLGKPVTSPFAVLARVTGGRCHHLQFMEDTFATAASFRSGGHWTFRSDPHGAEVTV